MSLQEEQQAKVKIIERAKRHVSPDLMCCNYTPQRYPVKYLSALLNATTIFYYNSAASRLPDQPAQV